MMDKYGEESVLVLNDLDGLDENLILTKSLDDVIKDRKVSFELRNNAEYSNEYKQIIPYIVVSNKEKILLSIRINKNREERLYGLQSIGLGGHVNPEENINTEELILSACIKEINEELEITNCNGCMTRVIDIEDLRFIGYINDNSNSVGKNHLGLVYHLELDDNLRYNTNEKDKLEMKVIEIKELEYEKLENWSRIIYDKMDRLR